MLRFSPLRVVSDRKLDLVGYLLGGGDPKVKIPSSLQIDRKKIK